MGAFLLDEDMPRSTARVLRESGHAADDVRDVGLQGATDTAVFRYALEHRLTLVTADKGFTNPLRFSPTSHWGVILVRLPNELVTSRLNEEVLAGPAALEGENLAGSIVTIELGRMRIRRTGHVGAN